LKKQQNGFTLIECLVALFIVAVVLASASRAIGLIISDVHDSFVREVATWVAENEYNQYLLNNQYPDLGIVKKKLSSAGVDFNVTETVLQTPNPYFRRIEITISEKSTPDHMIYKTVNFIAQY
jgi:general secretion pathway protein I